MMQIMQCIKTVSVRHLRTLSALCLSFFLLSSGFHVTLAFSLCVYLFIIAIPVQLFFTLHIFPRSDLFMGLLLWLLMFCQRNHIVYRFGAVWFFSLCLTFVGPTQNNLSSLRLVQAAIFLRISRRGRLLSPSESREIVIGFICSFLVIAFHWIRLNNLAGWRRFNGSRWVIRLDQTDWTLNAYPSERWRLNCIIIVFLSTIIALISFVYSNVNSDFSVLFTTIPVARTCVSFSALFSSQFGRPIAFIWLICVDSFR